MSNPITRRALLQQAAMLSTGAILPRALHAQATNATWITTTESTPWQTTSFPKPAWHWDSLDLAVDLANPAQKIEGFGGCFNELGWTSLNALTPEDRDHILHDLFAPGVGTNFNLCRMPIGANDFSRDWYSYDETPDDFSLQHFSIANDLETLVPFIKSAQHYNPSLQLWASPWSPPSWMKRNHHYAAAPSFPGQPDNGLRPDQVGHEGTDMFLQEQRYFQTYAAYFGRFIDAYKKQGIDIGMVMPQNEFNSAQPFPSSTWTPEGLARFIQHLGPEMAARHVRIFFGTLERGSVPLLETVLSDPQAGKFIEGVGVQWAGKNAVAKIHRRYPKLTIYQSEQECGDGKNDWHYAAYCWDLMKHYFNSGANAYMYWNISLLEGGSSHWGWQQNSLVTVDPATRTYRFNHEYYLLKHVSHFVQPGARRLPITGTFDNALAFQNPDRTIAVILRNETSWPRTINIALAGQKLFASMQPDSFNTLLLQS